MTSSEAPRVLIERVQDGESPEKVVQEITMGHLASKVKGFGAAAGSIGKRAVQNLDLPSMVTQIGVNFAGAVGKVLDKVVQGIEAGKVAGSLKILKKSLARDGHDDLAREIGDTTQAFLNQKISHQQVEEKVRYVLNVAARRLPPSSLD